MSGTLAELVIAHVRGPARVSEGAPVGDVSGQDSQMKANASDRTMRASSATKGNDVVCIALTVRSPPIVRQASAVDADRAKTPIRRGLGI